MKVQINKTNIPAFKKLLNSISLIVDEGIIKFKPNGLYLSRPDRGGACFINVFINKDFFEEYKYPDEGTANTEVGLSFKEFKKFFGASLNDTSSIEITENKIKLCVLGSSKREFIIPQISVAEEPTFDASTLNLVDEVLINTKVFADFIDSCEVLGDSTKITIEDKQITFAGNRDYSTFSGFIEEGVMYKKLKPVVKVVGNYNITYINNFLAAEVADVTKLKMSDNKPLEMTQFDGNITYSMLLAPREVME